MPLLTIAIGFVIQLGIVAFLLKKLVHNFDPRNPRNTWPLTLLASFLVSAVSTTRAVLFPDGAVFELGGALMLQALVLVVIYRLTPGLSVALIILVGVASLAIALGAGILYGISPLLAIAGAVVAIGLPVLSAYRSRQLRARLDAVE
jgi:hypothetical protein